MAAGDFDVAQACQGLADLVTGRQVLHPGDPLLDAHIAGSKKLHQGDGWRFVRRGAGHVDAAYAAAGAIHVALTVPYSPRLRPLVVAGRRPHDADGRVACAARDA